MVGDAATGHVADAAGVAYGYKLGSRLPLGVLTALLPRAERR